MNLISIYLYLIHVEPFSDIDYKFYSHFGRLRDILQIQITSKKEINKEILKSCEFELLENYSEDDLDLLYVKDNTTEPSNRENSVITFA